MTKQEKKGEKETPRGILIDLLNTCSSCLQEGCKNTECSNVMLNEIEPKLTALIREEVLKGARGEIEKKINAINHYDSLSKFDDGEKHGLSKALELLK